MSENEAYPGQKYFHENNPNIKRAELEHAKSQQHGGATVRCCNHPKCANTWPCNVHPEWNDGIPLSAELYHCTFCDGPHLETECPNRCGEHGVRSGNAITRELLIEVNMALGRPLHTDPTQDEKDSWAFFADALRQRLAARIKQLDEGNLWNGILQSPVRSYPLSKEQMSMKELAEEIVSQSSVASYQLVEKLLADLVRTASQRAFAEGVERAIEACDESIEVASKCVKQFENIGNTTELRAREVVLEYLHELKRAIRSLSPQPRGFPCATASSVTNSAAQPAIGSTSDTTTPPVRIWRRAPKPGETETPLFNALWRVVKWWEIEEGGTRWSATGDDVCGIIDSINEAQPGEESKPTRKPISVECPNCHTQFLHHSTGSWRATDMTPQSGWLEQRRWDVRAAESMLRQALAPIILGISPDSGVEKFQSILREHLQRAHDANFGVSGEQREAQVRLERE